MTLNVYPNQGLDSLSTVQSVTSLNSMSDLLLAMRALDALTQGFGRLRASEHSLQDKVSISRRICNGTETPEAERAPLTMTSFSAEVTTSLRSREPCSMSRLASWQPEN